MLNFLLTVASQIRIKPCSFVADILLDFGFLLIYFTILNTKIFISIPTMITPAFVPPKCQNHFTAPECTAHLNSDFVLEF